MAGILIEWRMAELLLGSVGKAEREARVRAHQLGSRRNLTEEWVVGARPPAHLGPVPGSLLRPPPGGERNPRLLSPTPVAPEV